MKTIIYFSGSGPTNGQPEDMGTSVMISFWDVWAKKNRQPPARFETIRKNKRNGAGAKPHHMFIYYSGCGASRVAIPETALEDSALMLSFQDMLTAMKKNDTEPRCNNRFLAIVEGRRHNANRKRKPTA